MAAQLHRIPSTLPNSSFPHCKDIRTAYRSLTRMNGPSGSEIQGRTDLPPCPRTLILDFRDSYTANLLTPFSTLYSPLGTSLPRHISSKADDAESGQYYESIAEKVVIVQADTLDLDTYLNLLKEKEIDCVILSPGPGRADREEVSIPSFSAIPELIAFRRMCRT